MTNSHPLKAYPPIEQFLPHDKPMVLVDRIIEVQEDSVHCQVDIAETNPFYNSASQSVPSYVGIEFMAQSVAAWSGYHAKQQDLEPPIGFLLGSRRYATEVEFYSLGQTLDIHASKLMEDNGMAVFSAYIELNGEKIGACQLNVFVPSEEKLEEMKIRSQS